MRELHTEIEIEAPPDRVWQVLTDFDAYPDWNPFIRSIRGGREAGARLSVRLEPPGGRGMTFRPTVRVVDPPHELRWLGHLLVPRLFDGEHIFVVEPLGEGRSRFVQRERFMGVLVAPLAKMLAATERGFEAMNAALKQRAEGT